MTLRFDDRKVPFIDLGCGNRLGFELEEFSDEKSVEKAIRELRETPEVVASATAELRDLIRQEANLKLPLDNELFLRRFLRPKKYYVDSTFEMVKAYYKMKARENFMLDNLSVASVRTALDECVVQVLPKRDQHGRRIILMEMGAKWDCSKVPSLQVARVSNLLLETIGREPATQLHGIVYVINFDKLSLSHIGQFPPKFVKTILEHGQKNSPFRFKAMHIVNNARMFNVLFKIFKPFLGKKWSQRIFLHGTDLHSLHEHIDQCCLPAVLGGTYEFMPYESSVLAQLLDHYKDKLDEENTYGYVQPAK